MTLSQLMTIPDIHGYISLHINMSILTGQLQVFDSLLSRKFSKQKVLMILFFSAVNHLNPQQQGIFATTLWCIWNTGNNKLQRDEEQPPSMAISWALQYLHEWKTCRNSKASHPAVTTSPNLATSWQPPSQGSITCKVNASIFARDNSFGAGIYFRNSQAQFIIAKLHYLHGYVGPQKQNPYLFSKPCLLGSRTRSPKNQV